MDMKRLCWANLNSADQIVRQLRAGNDIIRLGFSSGRKKKAGETDGTFFTYFGRDGRESLTAHFEVRES
jgi:hypothetical protein